MGLDRWHADDGSAVDGWQGMLSISASRATSSVFSDQNGPNPGGVGQSKLSPSGSAATRASVSRTAVKPESDGAVAGDLSLCLGLYEALWRANARVRVPDTLVFRKGALVSWWFTSSARDGVAPLAGASDAAASATAGDGGTRAGGGLSLIHI